MRADIKTKGVRAGRGQRHDETIDTSATDWQAAGKCAQPGARADDWFDGFGYAGQLPDATTDKAKAAKKLCAGCPITAACAEYAITNELWHGVFGGLTPSMRARIAARKPARRGAT